MPNPPLPSGTPAPATWTTRYAEYFLDFNIRKMEQAGKDLLILTLESARAIRDVLRPSPDAVVLVLTKEEAHSLSLRLRHIADEDTDEWDPSITSSLFAKLRAASTEGS